MLMFIFLGRARARTSARGGLLARFATPTPNPGEFYCMIQTGGVSGLRSNMLVKGVSCKVPEEGAPRRATRKQKKNI